MKRKYFKTTDIYLAAYLIYMCNTLIDIYSGKNKKLIFIFDNTDFINIEVFKFSNRISIEFGDFQDEIFNLRAAIDKNHS